MVHPRSRRRLVAVSLSCLLQVAACGDESSKDSTDGGAASTGAASTDGTGGATSTTGTTGASASSGADPTGGTGGVTTTASSMGCTPVTCEELGAECGPADDGCGAALACGECVAPEVCGALAPNQCDCQSEPVAELCQGAGAECGSVDVTDQCGAPQTVDCGGCAQPDSCGGGGTPNACGCTSPSKEVFCMDQGAQCGPVAADDSCGVPQNVDCGACSGYLTCSPAHACECTSAPSEPKPSGCDADANLLLTSPTAKYGLVCGSKAGEVPPESCAPLGVQDAKSLMNGKILLPFFGAGQCRTCRVCAFDGTCPQDYSKGVTFSICYPNSMPVCTL